MVTVAVPNWRTRVWKPILKDLASGDDSLAPLAKARIYDCRGTFVRLMLRGGKSALDVAKWAGHSPGVMFSHYANVIDELEGKDPVPAQEQIRLAREATEQIPSASPRREPGPPHRPSDVHHASSKR